MSYELAALGLYVITIAVGSMLAFRALKRQTSPRLMVNLHLLFAVAGTTILAGLLVSSRAEAGYAIALGLYLLAGLGGLYLANYRSVGTAPPRVIVGLHAGAAALGTAVLIGTSF